MAHLFSTGCIFDPDRSVVSRVLSGMSPRCDSDGSKVPRVAAADVDLADRSGIIGEWWHVFRSRLHKTLMYLVQRLAHLLRRIGKYLRQCGTKLH